jgi:hypothetical protein
MYKSPHPRTTRRQNARCSWLGIATIGTTVGVDTPSIHSILLLDKP